MDDQTTIGTCGQQDLHSGTSDGPIVTFALFAYNQEKYIREAVEAAFSQTYSPLEIILSDDCSSDRTFAIMQEMAAAYTGRSTVILRRNTYNLGTALHVQSVFDASSGELLVVAAGDDISTPDRVATLVMTWVAAGNPEGCVHSGRETFRDGKNVAVVQAQQAHYMSHPLDRYAGGHWLPVAAPTCAYTRGVLEHFPPLFGGSIIEDMPLFLRVAMIGRFVACDYPLVRQRLHSESLGTGYNISQPSRWNRFVRSKVIALANMQRDLAGWQGPINPILRRRIEGRILDGMHSASGLFLPETRSLTKGALLLLAIRLASAPIVTRNLLPRLIYMLDFFQFKLHRRLFRRLRTIFRSS